MTREAGILIGSIVTALCVAGFAAGIALLVVAHGMPAHTDEAHATALTIQYEQNYVKASREDQEAIERELAPLRTSKWKLHNAGLAIGLAAPVLLIAIFRFKLWDVRMLRYATTPLTRLRLLGLASGAWLALLPAFLLQLDDEYARDDLTPTIDTGNGLFLTFAPKYFMIIWIVMLLVGRFIVLRKAVLPANLWNWESERRRHSFAWTVVYGLFGSIFIITIAWSVHGFPYALPSLIVGLYVIASSRAALLNQRRNPLERPTDFNHKSTTT